jgi:hypothetical protein
MLLHPLLLLSCWAFAPWQPLPPAECDDRCSCSEALVRVTPVRETLVLYTEQPGQILPIEAAPLYAKISGYAKGVCRNHRTDTEQIVTKTAGYGLPLDL